MTEINSRWTKRWPQKDRDSTRILIATAGSQRQLHSARLNGTSGFEMCITPLIAGLICLMRFLKFCQESAARDRKARQLFPGSLCALRALSRLASYTADFPEIFGSLRQKRQKGLRCERHCFGLFFIETGMAGISKETVSYKACCAGGIDFYSM